MQHNATHSITSHFSWIPELLFTGWMYLMLQHLQTYVLTPLSSHTYTTIHTALLLVCLCASIISEWLYILFLMATLFFQYYDQRDQHNVDTMDHKRHAHNTVHTILYGIFGEYMVVCLLLFMYTLSTIHSLQFTSSVVNIHTHAINSLWFVCVFTQCACGLATVGLVAYVYKHLKVFRSKHTIRKRPFGATTISDDSMI